MNPLPRLLALGLLVILAALAAVLAVPAWTKASAPAAHEGVAATASEAPAAHPTSAMLRREQLVEFAERVALPLALTALALAIVLFASLALRVLQHGGTRSPFAVDRAEIGALTRLAEKSAAQSEALNRERRNREQAEEDATLHRQLFDRSMEEKIRLGRDLHDGLIQSLYAAGLTIESARAVATNDPAEADRRLDHALQALNRTIRDVRAYIAGLAPEELERQDFGQAMEALTAELGAGREVRFELKIDEPASSLLGADQHTEALQVAREAISNALRHGGASQLTIRLHQGDGEICLLVQDNGAGFDATHTSGHGHGLGNIQARARRLGADLRIDSTPGNGTRVLLTLPLLQTT